MDEDMEAFSRLIKLINVDYEAIFQISNSDTISDIRAKLHRLNNIPIDEATFLAEKYRSSMNYPLLIDNYISKIYECREKFETFKENLVQQENLMETISNKSKRLDHDMSELEHQLPNIKNIHNLEDKREELKKCKMVEASIRKLKLEFDSIINVSKLLCSKVYEKHLSKSLKNWQNLILACWVCFHYEKTCRMCHDFTMNIMYLII